MKVKRVTTRGGIVNGYSRQVWVGLGERENNEDDDYTLPEVTYPYVTKRALLKAIENGSAFLNNE